MKYLIDKNNFRGSVLSTVNDEGRVHYSGSLYGNGSDNLLLADYLKLPHVADLSVEVVEWDALYKLIEKYHESICGNWKEITEAEYWEALECLPPMQWHDINKRYNVFFCMEANTADIHAMYLKDRESGKYFTCLFSRFASDIQILESIQKN